MTNSNAHLGPGPDQKLSSGHMTILQLKVPMRQCTRSAPTKRVENFASQAGREQTIMWLCLRIVQCRVPLNPLFHHHFLYHWHLGVYPIFRHTQIKISPQSATVDLTRIAPHNRLGLDVLVVGITKAGFMWKKRGKNSWVSMRNLTGVSECPIFLHHKRIGYHLKRILVSVDG